MGQTRDKILSKLYSKDKSIEDSFYRTHHELMKEYGWIPLKEFLELPQQTINNLLQEINKDRRAEAKAAKKNRRGK